MRCGEFPVTKPKSVIDKMDIRSESSFGLTLDSAYEVHAHHPSDKTNVIDSATKGNKSSSPEEDNSNELSSKDFGKHLSGKCLSDIIPISSRVSQHYFHLIVKELSKTKKFLGYLEREKGVDLHMEWDLMQMKKRCQELEEKNAYLQNYIHSFQTVLEEMPASSEKTNAYVNMMLLGKVSGLEKEIAEKDEKVMQLSRQCCVLKELCKTLAIQQNTCQVSRHQTVYSDIHLGYAGSSINKDDEDDQVFTDTPIVTRAIDKRSGGRVPDPDISHIGEQNCLVTGENRYASDPAKLESSPALRSCSAQSVAIQTESLEPVGHQRNNANEENLKQNMRTGEDATKSPEYHELRVFDLEQQLQSLHQILLTQQNEAQENISHLEAKVADLEIKLSLEMKFKNALEIQLSKKKSSSRQNEYDFQKRIEILQSEVKLLIADKERLLSQLSNIKILPMQSTLHPDNPADSLVKEDKSWGKMDQRISNYNTSSADFTQDHSSLEQFKKDTSIKRDLSEEDFSEKKAISTLRCPHCLRLDFADEHSYHMHLQKCLD